MEEILFLAKLFLYPFACILVADCVLLPFLGLAYVYAYFRYSVFPELKSKLL